jgi:hypothetical protein
VLARDLVRLPVVVGSGDQADEAAEGGALDDRRPVGVVLAARGGPEVLPERLDRDGRLSAPVFRVAHVVLPVFGRVVFARPPYVMKCHVHKTQFRVI